MERPGRSYPLGDRDSPQVCGVCHRGKDQSPHEPRDSPAFSLDQEEILAERIVVRGFFLLHGRSQRRRHQKICGVSGESRHGQITTGVWVLVPKCHGRKPVGIYVADAALVTADNLAALGDTLFISRLPATYHECGRLIAEAVAHNTWAGVGVLAHTKPTQHRPATSYNSMFKFFCLDRS